MGSIKKTLLSERPRRLLSWTNLKLVDECCVFFCRAELAKLRAAGLSSYLSSPAGSLASPGAGVTGDKDKDEASRKRRASFENDDEMDDEPILHPRQV